MRMTTLDKAAWVLVLVGGLNWGLIGFFEYNLVEELLDYDLARVVYALVGLAAVWLAYNMYVAKTRRPAKD